MNNSAVVSPAPGGGLDYTLSGFDLGEVFSGSGKLDPVRIEIAVEFLRRSQQIQLERLQCIADGALLAAEQVQDVRLDLLEKGPVVDTASVILDLAVGLLLDSSVAGRVMKLFANTACKRLIARSAILEVHGKEFWKQSQAEYKVIKTFIGKQELYATINQEISGTLYLKHAKFWRKVGEMASNTDVQKDVVAAAKTARNTGKARLETKELAVEGDTPGVSLLGSVQEFTSTNRLLVHLQYQRMETFVRLGFMTGKETRRFLTLAEFEPLEGTLKLIRDRMKLLFEAIIWAGIFRFDELWGRFSARNGLKGVDSRLVDYWLRRFGPDITRWNRELGESGRKYRRLDYIGNWSEQDRLQKQAALGHYFITILNDLPQKLGEAKALVTSFDPHAK